MTWHVTLTPIRVFPDAESLGDVLAREIMAGIDAARQAGKRYLLGCPGGRTARPVYRALACLAHGADLRHVVIVMMDEYLLVEPGGGLRRASADDHFSCRRFAVEEIVRPLGAAAAEPVPEDAIWLPEHDRPEEYERRIMDAGGVDLFLVASGASDGHVAFLPPGSPLDGGSTIVRLAETTRRDNLATFPGFGSLDEVPRHGVSVGLGTIVRCSRQVILVLTGEAKRSSAERVLAARRHDPTWPATFIHECRDGRIWLDAAADPRRPDAPARAGRIS
jgi:glucosamine-6-phosphate deaminase